MKKRIKYGAFSSILAGVVGMVYCFPFLFSSHLENLVGAGFPFVAGAILAVGGLMTLARNQQVPGAKPAE